MTTSHAPTAPHALTAACLALLLAASPALGQSRHFQTSQEHFEQTAAQAARLVSGLDSNSDTNNCHFFVAVAMLYAVRSHTLAQLADLTAGMSLPEDQALARRKFQESLAYLNSNAAQDAKVLEGVAAGSANARVRETGLRLVNQLRVFDANCQTLARQ